MVKKTKEVVTEPIKESIQAKIARLSKEIGIELKTDKDIVSADRVSTGYLSIDYLLNGGMEVGTIISIYGAESSLKTTIGLKMLAEAQKRGDSCLILNIEEGFNPRRLIDLGIDTSTLAIYDEKVTGEEYYEIVSKVIDSFDFILIDSISAMQPKIDDDKALDESTIRGMEATMHSRGLRKVIRNKKECILVLIAHEKNKVNTPVPSTYMPGGKSPHYYSNYILNTKVKDRYDDNWKSVKQDINKERDNDIKGYELAVIGKKIRNASPNKTMNLQIELKTGDTRKGHEIAKMGLLTGKIIQGGAFYTIEGVENKIQGFDNLASFLDNDKDLYNRLYKSILKTIKE